MTGFEGFTDDALEFYDGLMADNSKTYWTAHKAVYDDAIAAPMQALVDALAPEFGPGRLFRPYRDVRFSKDKTPYKTGQAAFVGSDPGVGYYVQVDADGLLAGGGFRAHSTPQVDRFRRAVDDDRSGGEITDIVEQLRTDDFEIRGAQVKTRPRGYPADHPRIELLRYKEIMAAKAFGAPDWLATPNALDHVRSAWRRLGPLTTWVATHVGPA
jgi:uncharacterized protein (TIGR02453 family)